MDSLITIKTFTHPSELLILKGRLESEGIECFVKDELITQIIPLYSNAVGGVKLQVKESDVEKAMEILKDAGYLREQDAQPSSFYTKLDKATSKIPFLKKLKFEIRLLIVLTAIVSSIVLTIYYVTLPSTFERLPEYNWCVDSITYDGKDYTPTTSQFFQIEIAGGENCHETIGFRTNGIIKLPSFGSKGISGNWSIINDSLQIEKTDTFDFVYDGVYDVDLSKNQLILKSQKTTIYCHIEKTSFNFPF